MDKRHITEFNLSKFIKITSNLARNKATHISRRGNVKDFFGATIVFDSIKFVNLLYLIIQMTIDSSSESVFK